jgi:hypothetical protein
MHGSVTGKIMRGQTALPTYEIGRGAEKVDLPHNQDQKDGVGDIVQLPPRARIGGTDLPCATTWSIKSDVRVTRASSLQPPLGYPPSLTTIGQEW